MRRKLMGYVLLSGMVIALASAAVGAQDPTVPKAAIADALKAQLSENAGMRLHALVVGAKDEGVALVGKTPDAASSVRQGSILRQTINGVSVEVTIKGVTSRGVELAVSEGERKIFLPGTYTPLSMPTNPPAEFLAYVESDRVPIGKLLRLIADQTGVNISSTDAVAEKIVSIFLRCVTADEAVEEICRATGLWFRRDPDSRLIRVSTMAEYTDNLNSFREETTKTFTLLYPNVIEVASVIYGLYPERTLLSLGEEEFQEDDEYDLSRRFRRFRVLEENGNSQFMDMQPPRATGSGTSSGSGVFSFSRGSALSRLNQWDQLRNHRAADRFFDTSRLSANVAKELDSMKRSGSTNGYDTAYGSMVGKPANIFVSMSRKNNMLIVRTSDMKAMDEVCKLVKKLDVPTPMVLMEVKVLELDISDNLTATFEYSFNGYNSRLGGNLDENGNNIFADVVQTVAMDSFTPTFAFKAISSEILTKIQMLQDDGKVKTLATPTLLTANNEVSRIFDGEEYPLVSGWTIGETTVSEGIVDKTEPTVQIEKKDVGDMLLITPNINSDKTVTLRLLQENSYVKVGGAVIPVTGGTGSEKAIDYVVSRSLTGTFIAKDGMAVMAGGLINEKESEKYYRTPILGSIPLIGWLFRGTEKVKQRTEMIVIIRPYVIMTPFEGGKISEELAKALSAHPARDARHSQMTHRNAESGEGELKEHTLKDDAKNIIE